MMQSILTSMGKWLAVFETCCAKALSSNPRAVQADIISSKLDEPS
jgi:hypothetical protein